MRNAFMYILIGFIVALSLNNAVNRLCKRCFGIKLKHCIVLQKRIKEISFLAYKKKKKKKNINYK